MQSALDQFRISIQRVRDLIFIHNLVKAQATSALDLSDMLRAALVLSVSALDYYIHEVVTLGMLEIHRGNRPEPPVTRNANKSVFSKFKVSLGNAREDRKAAIDIASWLINDLQQNYGNNFIQQPDTIHNLIPAIEACILDKLNRSPWLENEIRESLSSQSFQQPDKIADAIRLISDKKLWNEVAAKLSRSAEDVKQTLINIVNRRNKIAHEADIDPTLSLGNRWPIDEIMVGEAVDFIEQVVESIHQIL